MIWNPNLYFYRRYPISASLVGSRRRGEYLLLDYDTEGPTTTTTTTTIVASTMILVV